MDNCYYHHRRDCVGLCPHCGRPICGDCHITYDDSYLCPNCIRLRLISDNTDAIETRLRLIKELKYMGVGFLVGLIISICAYFSNSDLVFFAIYAPFVCSSFFTILKHIRKVWGIIDGGETNARSVYEMAMSTDQYATMGLFMKIIMILIYIGFVIIFSPLVMLYRIVRRLLDYRKINQIISELDGYLNDWRSRIEAAGIDTNDVTALESDEDIDFNFDTSGIANYALSNTGEIIRKIDQR